MLLTDHGEEIGRKLAQHQFEVGMTLKQLFASYGKPPAGGITYAPEDSDLWCIQYGSEATSSYFEQRDGVITLARLGTPDLPSYVRDNMRLGSPAPAAGGPLFWRWRARVGCPRILPCPWLGCGARPARELRRG